MIEINCHSSIKITKGIIIYIDPFRINEEKHDADLILITHDHYDHYSPEDIKKVIKEDTIIVAPKTIKELNNKENIIFVEPNKTYNIKGYKMDTIPAYNINKHFHPKENNWVGYIIEIEGIKYYIAGDTDIIPENQQIKCDVALIPVGGTYTMDYKEASELINIIKPKIAIPTHYGSIVGDITDGEKFKKLIDNTIDVQILIK